MSKLPRFLFLSLIILLVIFFNFTTCNAEQDELDKDGRLKLAVIQIFDVYKDSNNPNVYHADSTNSSYIGTLKEVVEKAMEELNLAGGGTIAFRAGVFDLGSSYFKLVNKNNIIFEGQGIEVTIVKNNSNAPADTEPFNATNSNNITIRNLTVSAGGTPRSTSDAIDGDGANNWLIENVNIHESRARGIIFDGKGIGLPADNNTIRNCAIDGEGVLSDGIQLLSSNNNLIEGCTITNISNGIGISINKASVNPLKGESNKKSNKNIIRNNIILNSSQEGIRINSGDQNTIEGNTITGNTVDGIQLVSNDDITCSSNTIKSNTVTNNVMYGLNIAKECDQTEVWSDNNFTDNDKKEINDRGSNTIFLDLSADKEQPTAPDLLTITNVQDYQVDLSWNASTDNAGVTIYEVYRNSTKVDEIDVFTTSYQDITIAASTSYTYFVFARDFAGNKSPLSKTVSVNTLPPKSSIRIFTPTDDTTIRERHPNSNYGYNPIIKVDEFLRMDTLLRFNLTGLSKSGIASATLRLYAIDSSASGGQLVGITDNNWSENTVTWNNAPASDGILLGSLNKVESGQWYELDVTSLVKGNDPVSIRLSSDNRDSAGYASKENVNGKTPELVLTMN